MTEQEKMKFGEWEMFLRNISNIVQITWDMDNNDLVINIGTSFQME